MLGDKKVIIKVAGDYDPIPMDKYTVQIADVNFKVQRNPFKGIEEERLNFQFIILDDKPISDEDGAESVRGRYLWHSVTPALSPKSWLFKLAKAVYGRDLTKEEMESFDPESLIGKQVDVVVEQNTGKDGITVYSNITSYGKNIKKLPGIDVAPKTEEVVEKSTQPAKQVKVPNLNSTLDDPFLDDLEGDEEEKKEEDVEDGDDELEKLEAELKAKRAAKAKK
jgi:hypothetical protein